MPTEGLTIAELAALTDVPVRTIRYYVAQGLLPAPGREGPSTRYDEAFLARLRLIKQLRASHLPLAEIRARLAALTDAEAIALTETPAPEPPDSALDYVRGLLGGRTPALAEALPPAYDAISPADRSPEQRSSLLRRAAPAMPLDAVPAIPPPAAQAAPEPRAPEPPEPPPPTTTPTPERSQWERIVLEPDVELHVRRPLTRHQNRRVERLIAFARELHEGDKP